MVGVSKKLVVAVLAFIMSFSSNAGAADKAVNHGSKSAHNSSPKLIAVVDTHYLVENAAVFKDINRQIDEQEISLHKLSTAKEEEIRKKRDEVEKKRPAMDDSTYDKQIAAIDQDESLAQRDLQQKGATISQAKYNAYNAVQSKMIDVVSAIAIRDSYAAVLPKGVMIYYENDITTEALEKLNKEIPAIKLDFSDASAADLMSKK